MTEQTKSHLLQNICKNRCVVMGCLKAGCCVLHGVLNEKQLNSTFKYFSLTQWQCAWSQQCHYGSNTPLLIFLSRVSFGSVLGHQIIWTSLFTPNGLVGCESIKLGSSKLTDCLPTWGCTRHRSRSGARTWSLQMTRHLTLCKTYSESGILERTYTMQRDTYCHTHHHR